LIGYQKIFHTDKGKKTHCQEHPQISLWVASQYSISHLQTKGTLWSGICWDHEQVGEESFGKCVG
jgi:hypothetical protein